MKRQTDKHNFKPAPSAHVARRAAALFGVAIVAIAALSAGGAEKPIAQTETVIPAQAGISQRTGANNDNAFRLHPADIFNPRDFLINIANGKDSGDAFNNFYRRAQLQLFSTLDDALSQKAEDTLRENFSAVKTANIALQSQLGGRKGNLGINVIGAFDEAENHAIGWQMRVYAGQEESAGFNAGVFYRKAAIDRVIGVNAFADYEKHKHGNFFRYSFGGEVQHSHASFAANYYLPISAERQISSEQVAFSRQGFDAKVRINMPNTDTIRAALDYYHFNGEFGAEADKGFRYGAELRPLPALRFGVFYDGGSGSFGGDVAYSHTIGEPPQRVAAGAEFAPDLFAPVWREHSQRIAVATVAVPPSFGVLSRYAEDSRTVAIARLNIAPGYFTDTVQIAVSSSLPQGDFRISDQTRPIITIFYAPSAANQQGAATIFVHGTRGAQTVTSFVVNRISSFAFFDADFVSRPALTHVTATAPATVGTIRPGGGIPPYRYSSSHADVSIDNDGLVLFSNISQERSLIAVLTANDSTTLTPPIQITIALTAAAIMPINIGLAGGRQQGTALLAIPAGVNFLAQVTASGGRLDSGNNYNFTVNQPSGGGNGNVQGEFYAFAGFGPGGLVFGSRIAATVTATVVVNDDEAFTPPASLFFTVTAIAPIMARADITNANLVRSNTSDSTDFVGTIAASGGLGAYTYALYGARRGFLLPFGSSNNTIGLAQPSNSNNESRSSIVINDESPITPPLTIGVTARNIISVTFMTAWINPADGTFARLGNNQNFNRSWGFITLFGGTGGYTLIPVSSPGSSLTTHLEASRGTNVRRITIPVGFIANVTLTNVMRITDTGTYSNVTPDILYTLRVTIRP
ncbi:MAG: inverse autotransporter beta domain-containing protein [Gammaproteobacteria bacterium]